jgi:hypothetical protein
VEATRQPPDCEGSSDGVSKRELFYCRRALRLLTRLATGAVAYKFFFAQAPTRSRAFSMFSIELATLKRR